MFLLLLRRFRRRKTVSDPVTVVSRFVDAANRHDADAIAKCLHPDFESIQPIYPSRNFRGSMQVKRNWQAIFESEPGFRLSLVRSAANEGTVWVELHGAGRDVEVAGVFIMGVEDELVRWARVYSAVVEQPAPKMASHPESTVGADEPVSAREEAEAVRRLIDAGRAAAMAAETDVEVEVDDDTAAFAPEAETSTADDEPEPDDDDDDEYDDEDAEDDDDDESDDEDEDESEEDDDDEDEDDDDDTEDEEPEAVEPEAVEPEIVQPDAVEPGDGLGDAEPVLDADAIVLAAAAEVTPADGGGTEPDLPNPYADPDSFWQDDELHDLVGSAPRVRRSGEEDAVIVEFSDRLGDPDEHDGDDPTHGRSRRRRGGRRRR